jgi:hypothetical protein
VSDKELRAKLKNGTRLHRKIAEAIRGRLRMSEQRMSDRYKQMAQNEELFQAYIPERDVDALRRQERERKGVMHYRTVEIPYSYAVLMTMHTYYSSVFLARNPIFQLSGRHGEGETNKVAFESLLQYQVQVGMMALPLYVWLLDPGKYGYSVLGHHWDTEKIRIRTKQKRPRSFLGMPIPGTEEEVDVVNDVLGYEGNRAFNVRAQDFFPDPRIALVHFQRGEFCGRFVETPWNEIYEGQQSGRYFNYEALKKARDGRIQEGGTPARDEGSERVTKLPEEEEVVEGGYDVPIGYVKGHEFYIRLIPNQWELGKEDQYEIWAFNISTNGIIFGAEPLGELNGKFPFDMLVDEIDGYTIAPRSTLERIKPLNDVISWLVNTHFYNVRAALNDKVIADPSMVVMKDLQSEEPGKIIRLKPLAYGKDVRTMVHQLATIDVTQGHLKDLTVWQDFIQRVTGANDTIMGMINPGGRKTATEVRSSTSFGVNRLKTQCEWFSATGFAPLVQGLVQRTQQHYTRERKFRLVGDTALLAPTFDMVTPEQIAGFYDYEPVDGTLPVDRFAQANLWQMIMGQLRYYPQIMMQYDIAKIFAWVANLAGIKNMAQFRVVPDQMMMQQATAGNVVPISQAGSKTNTNLNEPRQIPGVGPTG